MSAQLVGTNIPLSFKFIKSTRVKISRDQEISTHWDFVFSRRTELVRASECVAGKMHIQFHIFC